MVAAPGIEIIGESAAFAYADLAAAEVIIVDEALISDLAFLPREAGQVAVLALTDNDSAVGLLRSLALVGWGILPRDSSADELQAAVRAVAAGLVVVPVGLASRVLNRVSGTTALNENSEALTGREREVLDLLAQGLSNKQIARRLQISDHTVKFHVSSIFAKLGVASRTEAVSLGARQGLITL
jgi:DNA-binding NarL/FixJ family response regulator